MRGSGELSRIITVIERMLLICDKSMSWENLSREIGCHIIDFMLSLLCFSDSTLVLRLKMFTFLTPRGHVSFSCYRINDLGHKLLNETCAEWWKNNKNIRSLQKQYSRLSLGNRSALGASLDSKTKQSFKKYAFFSQERCVTNHRGFPPWGCSRNNDFNSLLSSFQATMIH